MTERRSSAAFYLVLGLGLVAGAAICAGRLWGDQFLGRADLVAHVRLALSASRELAAGNWFLAYVNDTPVAFQPFFLYYSVLPAYISGLFSLSLGVSAYDAVLLTFALGFVVAGLGVALVCRYLRVGFWPSALAACAYAFSPYAFDDLYARGALPEFTANALLPVYLWALLRCYASRGRRAFVLATLLTAALMLTHKIQLPWFLLAFGGLVLLQSLWPRTSVRQRLNRVVVRMLATAGAVVLGVAITAPYWLEAYQTVPHLLVARYLGSAYESATQGLRIFWPLYTEAPGAIGTALSLQLGAPAVLGAILSLASYRRGLLLAFGVTALASALMVAAGPGVWRLVPSILASVQFPYRLLAQATLFGVLGLALALQRLELRFRQASARYALASGSAALVLLTAVIFAHPLPDPPYPPAKLFEDDARIPSILHVDYVLFPDDVLANLSSVPGSAFEADSQILEQQLSARFYGQDPSASAGSMLIPRTSVDVAGNRARALIAASGPGLYVLPVQFSPYVQVTEADEADRSQSVLTTENVDGKTAVRLGAGSHRLLLVRGMAPLALPTAAAGLLGLGLVVLVGSLLQRTRRSLD